MNILNLDQNKYYKVLFFSLAFMAIVDSLNGFLVQNNLPSFGQPYRLIFFVFLFLFTYINNKLSNIIYINFMFLYIFTIMSISFFYHQSLDGLLYELIKVSKFIFIIFIIESYKNYVTDYKTGLMVIEKIINYNIVLFPLSIIIPRLLNIGYYVYSDGSGYKGFYKANNELSIVFVFLFIFVIDRLYQNINIKNIILFMLVLISIYMIGSKVAIVVPLGVIFIYLCKSIINYKNKYIFSIMVVSIFLIILYLGFNLYVEDIMKIYGRQKYFYYKFKDTPLTFILSSRNNFLEIMINNFKSTDLNFLKFLFGYGMYIKDSIIANELVRNLKEIEMDFFDIYYSYGIIGIIIIYGYFIKYIKPFTKTSGYYFKYRLSFIIIIILGFLGGHVFWGALAGSIFSIVVCGLISINKISKV